MMGNLHFRIILFFALSTQTLFSQIQVTQHTVSSTSESYLSSSLRLDYTIGELSAVTTIGNGNYILTQGLHQPDKAVVGIAQTETTDWQALVYPNPFDTEFTLRIVLNKIQILYGELFDMNGKLVQNWKIEPGSLGVSDFQFLIADIPEAPYWFRLSTTNGEQKMIFKLIRMRL
jgi:hypothetical protein